MRVWALLPWFTILDTGCELGVLHPIECTRDEECANVFGDGAVCSDHGLCDLLATISGTVTRVAALAPDSDGEGQVYVAALDDCNEDPPIPLGYDVEEATDLASNPTIDFKLEKLPRKLVQVIVFFDDDGNAVTAGGYGADPGDLVSGAGGCLPIDLTGGSVDGEQFSLDYLIPG